MGAGFECAERLGRRGALCRVEARDMFVISEHGAPCNHVCGGARLLPMAVAVQ